MKQLIDRFAHYVAKSQSMDKEQEAVIAYGMLAMTQFLCILLFSLLFGFLTHTVVECLIIYFVVGTFRRFTGGAHGNSLLQCCIVSVCSIVALALLSVYALGQQFNLYTSAVICAFIFFVVSIIVYRKAPVDSPNKPITRPEKIKRLRFDSFLFLVVSFLCCALFFILAFLLKNNSWTSLAFSVCLALFWQAINLTSLFARFNR